MAASAQIPISDSFTTTGRFDDLGAPISAGVLGTPSHPELAGVQVESGSPPFPGNRVWLAPGHSAATWSWGGTGQVFADADATGRGVDAMLAFTPSTTTPYQLSLDVFPNGGGGALSIGFSSDHNVVNDNFASAGQTWLTISGLVAAGSPATWTLHRSGGLPDQTGSAGTLPNAFVALTLAYDPVAHKVSGSANGVSIGTFDFTDSGIAAVGFESSKAALQPGFVQVDNFAVSAVPEPQAYGLIATLGLAGMALWRRRNAA